ncbi:HAD hydrolase-like protein [Bifidobacterium sp. W8115]|uniref:HAD hydrolase-like protein n=1 Tax=Bifidobacterium TaxID=1678 RepID=UPI0018DEA663|nr:MULTISPECIES: HAD hydrolase-like protein [Bifidobacterium]MBI0072195.1 HAD hydrolase-like protein [Bifidobacterium sp. W8112]MBI0125370.1 HAD hydrolase-like protein [Bifidobacterium apousia]
MSKSPRRLVLLDLDGTLTASHPGIIASVVQTFKELGHPVPDESELRRFIGPAVEVSLRRNGIREEDIDKGVQIYRRYYSEIAAFDDPDHPGQHIPGRLLATVFDSIPEQLNRMHRHGLTLAVATCKPEYQAQPVCDHFGLTPLVDGVYGASKDSTRITKAQVITHALQQLGFDTKLGDRALMVGDRWTDADGALETGLDCLGCGWGYAEPGELESHGCYRVINQVDQLCQAAEDYFDNDPTQH